MLLKHRKERNDVAEIEKHDMNYLDSAVRCFSHSLGLACTDTVKNCKLIRNMLDAVFEITKLVKYSPKYQV